MAIDLQHHDPRATLASRLTIRLATGTGTGPTALAAFDAALVDCGIANFNLLKLSSVIPMGAALEHPETPSVPAGGWGDRLYVVMAEQRASDPGEEAWAGIGWVRDAESGRGLFVEHEGVDRDKVEQDIAASLGALVAVRPDHTFGPPQMLLRGTQCIDEPVCAMVVAIYESDPWRGEPVIDLR